MSETSSVTSGSSVEAVTTMAILTGREVGYMNDLRKKMIEKRGVSESTATQTIAALQRMNGGVGFTNLKFLTDVASIRKWIEDDHSPETQKMYYCRAIAALDTMDSGRYKSVLETYRSLFNGAKDVILKEKEARGTGLTAKEKEVWMSWPEIQEHYKKKGEQAKAILKKKTEMTAADYDTVQDHMLLALFTQMPPRRTMDYSKMWVTRKEPGTDLTKNYYVAEQGKMYFNTYKTAKYHGQQVMDVPKPVQDIIWSYMKLTGNYRATRGKSQMMPLVCSYDGAHYAQTNKMTLLLNRAFGKKISCNILRHSYVSNLYTPAVADMAKTATSMAHDIHTHLSYFRTADTETGAVGGAGTGAIEHV